MAGVAMSIACTGVMSGASEAVEAANTDAPKVQIRPDTGPESLQRKTGKPGESGKANANDGSTDRLFERLRQTRDEAEGEGVARRIEERWLRSGSPTADLLMRRAVVATLGGEQELGVELLDRVIAIRPNWAEAWSRRAALFVLMGDDQRAALDLQKALMLEPRHYQALAAMGLIFSKNDDNRNAVKAWRQSLALNPFQEELKQRVQRLAPDVDGRDL